MTEIWGVHMPAMVGTDPVDGGYVSIGWPAMGDIFAIPQNRDVFKKKLETAYPEAKPGAVPVDAGTMYKFVHEVTAGDVIVYPSKIDRLVHIGHATGDKRHDPTGSPWRAELPNQIGVKWEVHLPREIFAQSALNEIGSFITLFRIRKHSAEFLSKLGKTSFSASSTSIEEDAPLPDDVASQSASILAEENTADFIVRRLHGLVSGHDFEHFVSHLMECMGYSSRVTPKSGDGGVDVIAHSDQLGFQPPIIKVQCKRQTGQTGEPEVSQLLGTLGDGEYALYVTLGSYSKQARVRERNDPRARLLDGDELVQLILQHYPKLSPRYRLLLPLKQTYVPDLPLE